jgi:preprotein translocase subunit YajC
MLLTIAGTLASRAMILAQTTTAPAAPEEPMLVRMLKGGGVFLPLGALLLLYVFMMSGSKRKEEKKRQDLLTQIKRGARVQTIGGIIGKVVDVEDDRILLKVDESSNTKIWFARTAVHRTLGEEKAAGSGDSKTTSSDKN